MLATCDLENMYAMSLDEYMSEISNTMHLQFIGYNMIIITRLHIKSTQVNNQKQQIIVTMTHFGSTPSNSP